MLEFIIRSIIIECKKFLIMILPVVENIIKELNI
jgi:hypothetical protein